MKKNSNVSPVKSAKGEFESIEDFSKAKLDKAVRSLKNVDLSALKSTAKPS